ncbi:MAG: hypothetical protein AB7O47_08440 [Flavobacteriales bacterium]
MVKQTFAILLLITLLFNTIGVVVLFKIQQYQVKKEIKQRIKQDLPPEELTTIVLTQQNSHEFDWEHEREFRYKRIMYDVVKKERVNETTTLLHCITDNQETALFAKLNEEVKKNMDSKNNGTSPLKNVFKLLSSIYFPNEEITLHLDAFLIKKPLVSYSCYYQMPFIDITSPPPELV